MIKLVLSDMDNTLVPYGQAHASERTLAAIHACLDEGIAFGPATGRNLIEVAGFLCHDERCYQSGIVINGQQVYLNGALVHEVTFDRTTLLGLADVLRDRRGCALLTYSPEGRADWIGDTRQELEPIINEAAHGGDRRCDELPDYPITKVGIIANIERDAELALHDELAGAFPALDFPNTVPTWFDVIPHGLNKATGIGILQKAMGISPDEICVFGDAENDLAMFAQVRHSCSVANADPEIQAHARWHIGASAEDGVAIALEQIAEAARFSRERGTEVPPAFMTAARDEDVPAEDERPGAEADGPDLFAQTIEATRIALDGAADAYRETFQDFQAKLPSFDEVVAQAVRLPGSSINRASYLTEVLQPKHAPIVVQAAIQTTPARAGLTPRQIERIAKKSLGRDGRRTTALSFAAGIPGGVAGAVTIPADLVQFYGYLIRAIQKLTYLYGWRDLVHIEEGAPDLAASNAIIIMLGVMVGNSQADAVLARLARLRAAGASDQALRTALAEQALSVQVKQISDALTMRMAKRLGGQVAGKAIPIVGGIVSGVITGSGFDEMAKRLLKELKRHGT